MSRERHLVSGDRWSMNGPGERMWLQVPGRRPRRPLPAKLIMARSRYSIQPILVSQSVLAIIPPSDPTSCETKLNMILANRPVEKKRRGYARISYFQVQRRTGVAMLSSDTHRRVDRMRDATQCNVQGRDKGEEKT